MEDSDSEERCEVTIADIEDWYDKTSWAICTAILIRG
jgi:hypothetical protein